MAYCPNCGGQLVPNMRFCPNCGQDLSVLNRTPGNVNTVQIAAGVHTTTRNDYHIALMSRGACNLNEGSDILEDMLGYTDADAKLLLRNAPVEIACNLNESQALYLARALTEYGLQVSVYNSNGTVTFNNHYNTSVFDTTGNYISEFLGILTGLTVANRVTRIAPMRGPAYSPFTLDYRPARPPVHRRRTRPVPPPPPVHSAPHRPAPIPPRPAPRPAPQGGSMGPGRGPTPNGPGSMGPGGHGPGGSGSMGPGGRGPGGPGPFGGRGR